jgi:hypothetical protein
MATQVRKHGDVSGRAPYVRPPFTVVQESPVGAEIAAEVATLTDHELVRRYPRSGRGKAKPRRPLMTARAAR